MKCTCSILAAVAGYAAVASCFQSLPAAEPADYKAFVKASQKYTLKERKRRQADNDRLRKAGKKYVEHAQKAAARLSELRGALVAPPLPEVRQGGVGTIRTDNSRQLIGQLGAAGFGRGKIRTILGPDSALVEMMYPSYQTSRADTRVGGEVGRFITGVAPRAVAATRLVVIESWPTEKLKEGEVSELPAVVEFMSYENRRETYRAVTFEELRPYLRGKKIVGLTPGSKP